MLLGSFPLLVKNRGLYIVPGLLIVVIECTMVSGVQCSNSTPSAHIIFSDIIYYNSGMQLSTAHLPLQMYHSLTYSRRKRISPEKVNAGMTSN